MPYASVSAMCQVGLMPPVTRLTRVALGLFAGMMRAMKNCDTLPGTLSAVVICGGDLRGMVLSDTKQ